jgi:hypothetical protein
MSTIGNKRVIKNDIKRHLLKVGEFKQLDIDAWEEYSSNRITITEGEIYHVWCDDKQYWKDSILPSATPSGFFNALALIAGMRVKKTKCFCLCGAYNEKDSTGFSIGIDKTFITHNGYDELSFFPNDTKNFYKNNQGSITINIMRLK